MSNEKALTTLDDNILESLVINGDLSKLNSEDRVRYYIAFCQRIGLDAATQPFKILRLQGKEQLYCDRGGAAQLKAKHRVSRKIVSREEMKGCYVVTAQASRIDGEIEEAIGAVPIEGLKGEALCNAMMKAETKAKRRATLDLLGLGVLDESELGEWSSQGQTVDVESGQTPPQTSGSGSKTASKPSTASQQRQSTPSENAEGWKGVQIHFGKNSGTPLGKLNENSRLWYQVNWQPDANRTSQKDQDLRDALDMSISELADDAVLRGAFKSAIQKFAEEKKLSESELDLFNREAAKYIKQSEPDTDVTDVKNLNAVNLQMIYLKRDEFLDTIRDTAAAE